MRQQDEDSPLRVLFWVRMSCLESRFGELEISFRPGLRNYFRV